MLMSTGQTPSIGIGVSLQWRCAVPFHKLIEKMARMVKKNNISTKMLPSEKTESSTVVSSFFIAGIAFSERSGLSNLNVLNAEIFP